MEALWNVLETGTIAAAGLAIRFLLVLGALSIAVMILLPFVYAAEGIRRLLATLTLQRVGGLRWRAQNYYTPAHEWLRERAGRLRIGIDDLAAHLIRRTDRLTLPVAGTRLAAGDPLLTVADGNGRLVVTAPVAGVVTRVNPYLVNHPTALQTDPYRRGWLVELAPADDAFRRFPYDEAAKDWFAAEAAMLPQALAAAAGASHVELRVPPAVVRHDPLAGRPPIVH